MNPIICFWLGGAVVVAFDMWIEFEHSILPPPFEVRREVVMFIIVVAVLLWPLSLAIRLWWVDRTKRLADEEQKAFEAVEATRKKIILTCTNCNNKQALLHETLIFDGQAYWICESCNTLVYSAGIDE